MRSPRPHATPLLLTHGWPGSFLEFESALAPLTTGEPAFDIVVPSLPGYGFSGRPAEPGFAAELRAGLVGMKKARGRDVSRSPGQ